MSELNLYESFNKESNNELKRIQSYITQKEEFIEKEKYEIKLLCEKYVDISKNKVNLAPLIDYEKITSKDTQEFKKKKNYNKNTPFEIFMNCLKTTLNDIWDKIDNFSLIQVDIPTIGLNFRFHFNRKKYELFIPNYKNFDSYYHALNYNDYILLKEVSPGWWDKIYKFEDEIQLRDNIGLVMSEEKIKSHTEKITKN